MKNQLFNDNLVTRQHDQYYHTYTYHLSIYLKTGEKLS